MMRKCVLNRMYEIESLTSSPTHGGKVGFFPPRITSALFYKDL